MELWSRSQPRRSVIGRWGSAFKREWEEISQSVNTVSGEDLNFGGVVST